MAGSKTLAELAGEGEVQTEKNPVVQKPAVEPTKVTIPDQRPQYMRKSDNYVKMQTSIGLSRQYLPPITKRRQAIYQLLNTGRDSRLRPEDQVGSEAIPYDMVPTYQMYDQFDSDVNNRDKVLTYSEGKQLVYVDNPGTGRKEQITREKLGEPHFTNGQVIVDTIKDYTRYVWWELHPRNASNKWRDKSKPAIFKRVDIERSSPHVQMMQMDLKMDAEQYVIKLDLKELINLAAAMTNPTINVNMPSQQLRYEMRMRAQEDPEGVMFKAPDKIASIKLSIMHGMDMGIIFYEPSTETYFNGEDEEMFVVPVDNNPTESFAKFLSSEQGKESRDYISEKLAFWF
jgi:hypothetical protein